MSDVTIEYIGLHDEVEIAATGQTCKHGETVTVSAELAGRPPVARLAKAQTELAELSVVLPDPAWAVDVAEAHTAKLADLRAEIAAADHGEGLLAQPANWKHAKPAPTEKTEGE